MKHLVLSGTILIAISCFIFSCKPKTKNSSNKYFNSIIDYNNVDLFPVLPECKNKSATIQKICFYTFISKRIQQSLNSKNISIQLNTVDSIRVKLLIDTVGKASVILIKHSNKRYKNYIKIDSAIKKSIENLPKMKPAVKMGIPVKSAYILPIILKPDR